MSHYKLYLRIELKIPIALASFLHHYDLEINEFTSWKRKLEKSTCTLRNVKGRAVRKKNFRKVEINIDQG